MEEEVAKVIKKELLVTFKQVIARLELIAKETEHNCICMIVVKVWEKHTKVFVEC